MLGRLGSALQDPSVRRQFARYLIVGASGAVLEYALFAVLERGFGRSIATSNFIAMAIAVTYNFLMSRFWTFPLEGKAGVGDLTRSAVPYVLLFAINNVITTWMIHAAVGAGVDSLVAKLAAMALVVIWNFVLYRTVIFRSR